MAERFGIRPLQLGEFAIIGAGPDGVIGGSTERGVPYESSNGLTGPGDVFFKGTGEINR